MKTTIRPLIAALAAVGVAGTSWYAAVAPAGDAPPAAAKELPATPGQPGSGATGLAGNMLFVDEHGNPRMPTPAEMRTLSDALKKDLARITGPHRGKRYQRTLPSGAVAATVATSELVFLTAAENEDGTLTIRHSGIADDAVVAPEATATAPEM